MTDEGFPDYLGGYEVRRVIGRGTMGIVYEVFNHNVSRAQATKSIQPHLLHGGDQDRFRHRFLSEARFGGHMKHPGLVTVYDAGEDDDGTLWISMELINGGDLDGLLNRQGPLTPEQGVHVFTPVAGALHALHAVGLVHRDIKPANVLLDSSTHPNASPLERLGRGILGDFGIAAALEELGTYTHDPRIGSHTYHSPERHRGEPASPASDTYALATVIYQALTGTLPFGDDVTDIFRAHIRGAHIGEHPRLSIALNEVLDRAMHPDPEQRITSADVLMAQVQQAAGMAPSSAQVSPLAGGPRAGAATFRQFDYDPESDHFYRITHWNKGRQLTPRNVSPPAVMASEDVPAQDWIPSEVLHQYKQEELRRGGSPCTSIRSWDLGSVRSYQVDDRESIASQQLRITVAQSHYSDFVAAHRYFEDHPQSLAEVRRRIRAEGMQKVMETAPLSGVAINVTVLTADNLVLMSQRATGARTYPGTWGAGPHETLNWPQHNPVPGDLGAGVEDFFQLARRALYEEVHLLPEDYGHIIFSWFGVWLKDVTYYIIAHIRTHLNADEVMARAIEAHSAFEFEDQAWIPLDLQTLQTIVAPGPTTPPLQLGSDSAPRYLPTSRLALSQLWRIRQLLG